MGEFRMGLSAGVQVTVEGIGPKREYTLTQEDIDRGYLEHMFGIYFTTTGGLADIQIDLATMNVQGSQTLVRHHGWWHIHEEGIGVVEALPRCWELSWDNAP